jgi:hypothetical protein
MPMNTVETWNRLPRVIRGGTLAVLGAAGATGLIFGIGSSHDSNPRTNFASFPVGVGCAEKPSGIESMHSGNDFTFRCINPDGTYGVVSTLGQLVFDHSADPEGYDAVVTITSPDITDMNSVVSFAFSGDNGVATIGILLPTGPTENNDQLNATLRVPNNNTTS